MWRPLSVLLAVWVTCAYGQERECEVPRLGPFVMATPRKEKYKVGEVLKFSCKNRLVRVGPDSIQCYHFGWSPQPPTCREYVKNCGPPPLLSNAISPEMGKEVYEHSAVVEYVCASGFLMKGAHKIQCVDGEWTALPQCIAKSETICPPPPQIPNAQIMTTTVNYQDGDKISILCQENYLLQESEEIECKNGIWQSIPQCVEKGPCSEPPQVEHGYMISASSSMEPRVYPHGTRLYYGCQEGFTVVGEDNGITCFLGKWSSPPQCVESTGKCGPPPPIDNGDIISYQSQEYAPESTVDYQCQSYYILKGDSTIVCRNGRWSDPPTCIIPCTISEDIMNKQKIRLRWLDKKKLYIPSGETVEFVCQSGYSKVSPHDSFRTTCVNGELKYPTCAR